MCDSTTRKGREQVPLGVFARGGWRTEDIFDVLTAKGDLKLPFGSDVFTKSGILKPNISEIQEDGFRPVYIYSLPINQFPIPFGRKKTEYPKEAAVTSQHTQRLMLEVRFPPSFLIVRCILIFCLSAPTSYAPRTTMATSRTTMTGVGR